MGCGVLSRLAVKEPIAQALLKGEAASLGHHTSCRLGTDIIPENSTRAKHALPVKAAGKSEQQCQTGNAVADLRCPERAVGCRAGEAAIKSASSSSTSRAWPQPSTSANEVENLRVDSQLVGNNDRGTPDRAPQDKEFTAAISWQGRRRGENRQWDSADSTPDSSIRIDNGARFGSRESALVRTRSGLQREISAFLASNELGGSCLTNAGSCSQGDALIRRGNTAYSISSDGDSSSQEDLPGEPGVEKIHCSAGPREIGGTALVAQLEAEQEGASRGGGVGGNGEADEDDVDDSECCDEDEYGASCGSQIIKEGTAAGNGLVEAPKLEEKGGAESTSEQRGSRGYSGQRNIRDYYNIVHTIGSGGFSTVKLGVEKATGRKVALKIVTLPPEGPSHGDSMIKRADVLKEIDILAPLEHPNLVKLFDYYEDGSKIYLVMELLTGGELLDEVVKRGKYSEHDAQQCFRQLMAGIGYLHRHNVVHRDLKLENLILSSPDDMDHVKIVDFGLATRLCGQHMATICGTPQYVAPEVITGGSNTHYTSAVDIWSAGVVLYILLAGYPPFFDENEPVLFEKIRNGQYDFDDHVWQQVSSEAKDLISLMLVVDPKQRLTAQQVIEHKWMTQGKEKRDLVDAYKNLRAFCAKRKLRGLAFGVIAANRLTTALRKLALPTLSCASAPNSPNADVFPGVPPP